MTFGPEVGDGARITELATFNQALDVFQKRGYKEVDTARVYVGGKQEAFTREAGWRERGLVLATKVEYPAKGGDNRADRVVASVEESLKALGTDSVDVSERIPRRKGEGGGETTEKTTEKKEKETRENADSRRRQILYLHRPDRGTPFQETLEAMDKLHKAGKFRRLGISNFAAFEVAEVVLTCEHMGWVRPTVYQGMYNIITRHLEPELLVACRRYGLEVVVYNPIAGGLFSGKIKTKDMIPQSGRFSNVSSTMGARYRERYLRDSTLEAMQLMEAAAEKQGLRMIEVALRWLVHHSKLRVKNGKDGILIGVSTVAQLEDNLEMLEKGPLPEEVIAAADRAWELTKAEAAPYWHGELEFGYERSELGPGRGRD